MPGILSVLNGFFRMQLGNRHYLEKERGPGRGKREGGI